MEKQLNYQDKGENPKENKLKPVHGILLFVVVMISFYTIIAWAQMKWGMYGQSICLLIQKWADRLKLF